MCNQSLKNSKFESKNLLESKDKAKSYIDTKKKIVTEV